MMTSLPIGFAQPLILLALIGLPALWWLLRLVPPRPRQVHFPPTRLLFEIAAREETPARTPWWLMLLRLALAALVIIAAAEPSWNPPFAIGKRDAPLLVLLDDGWSAAAAWGARLRAVDELITRADIDKRSVAVLPLSEKKSRHFVAAGGFGTCPSSAGQTEAIHDRPKRCSPCHRAIYGEITKC